MDFTLSWRLSGEESVRGWTRKTARRPALLSFSIREIKLLFRLGEKVLKAYNRRDCSIDKYHVLRAGNEKERPLRQSCPVAWPHFLLRWSAWVCEVSLSSMITLRYFAVWVTSSTASLHLTAQGVASLTRGFKSITCVFVARRPISSSQSARRVRVAASSEHTRVGSRSAPSIMMSSANSWCTTEVGRTEAISLVYWKKRRDPRTLPWGTPLEQIVDAEILSPIRKREYSLKTHRIFVASRFSTQYWILPLEDDNKNYYHNSLLHIPVYHRGSYLILLSVKFSITELPLVLLATVFQI